MQSNLYQANSSESSSHLPKSRKSFPLVTVKLTCIKRSPLLSSRGHLSRGDQVHSYNTRNSNTSYLLPARTNIRFFDLRLQGPKAFNSFNRNIQSAATIYLSFYCAFHKHANSKVQKPPSQLRFSLPSIIITITSNEPGNTETHKTDRNPPITNHKP